MIPAEARPVLLVITDFLGRHHQLRGRRGIRTPGPLSGSPAFKAGAINRSAILPCQILPVRAAVLLFLVLRIFLAASCGLLFQAVELRMSLTTMRRVASHTDDAGTPEADPCVTCTCVSTRRRAPLFYLLVAVGTADLHGRKIQDSNLWALLRATCLANRPHKPLEQSSIGPRPVYLSNRRNRNPDRNRSRCFQEQTG